MEYGLIGKTLKHSFSKTVHSALADYDYVLHPLPDQKMFQEFMERRNFQGINVTIPYKKEVIPYCHQVEERAREIGAINTIVNKEGKLYGYNTDYHGFLHLTQELGLEFADKIVMILGTGGTCQTAKTVAKHQGAREILVVSRSAQGEIIDYQMAKARRDVQILINTTPVGMSPDNQSTPITLETFPNLQGVVDAVYNPLRSTLVQQATDLGIPATGGLAMLVAQAKYACEIFTGQPVPGEKVTQITGQILAERSNLVLIGMPSSGKSTVGWRCAQEMNRSFVDIDHEITREIGMPIAEFFQKRGEPAFRAIESRICRQYAKQTGLVISTGGGLVLDPANITALKQNGVLLYVKRELSDLQTGGNRPLLPDKEAVARLYAQRAPIYESAQDFTVENNQPPEVVAQEIKEAYYEMFGTQRP